MLAVIKLLALSLIPSNFVEICQKISEILKEDAGYDCALLV
jgi:hypothetical protein